MPDQKVAAGGLRPRVNSPMSDVDYRIVSMSLICANTAKNIPEFIAKWNKAIEDPDIQSLEKDLKGQSIKGMYALCFTEDKRAVAIIKERAGRNYYPPKSNKKVEVWHINSRHAINRTGFLYRKLLTILDDMVQE